uniref:protocadherin gamma-C5-like n=1 Tax=Oncorhynchus gorbuscha TaxID=8017 RepID=UPI001EAF1285|nr:protocadherin gamma-C5-like [Oncorhynchus gorbuscha]
MRKFTLKERSHLSDRRGQVLWLFSCFLSWNTTGAQIRYTVPEEFSVGSVVGNIAKDLNLDVAEISDRKLRIASVAGKQYFSVNLGKGDLVVSDRIDRDSLCGQSISCLLPLEVIVENPLMLHRMEVEMKDINDNAPQFQSTERTLKIAESTAPGMRFSLESAQDPDVGDNSLKYYTLSKNEHFRLKVQDIGDGRKVPELVLVKALDRENKAAYQLLLTALDGTSQITRR